jgi:hypothetical protein
MFVLSDGCGFGGFWQGELAKGVNGGIEALLMHLRETAMKMVLSTIDCLFRNLSEQAALLEVVEYLSWQNGFAGWWLALEPRETNPRQFCVRVCWHFKDGRSFSVETPLLAKAQFCYR